ncbi:hypothetical protein [Nannocystis pusilla]|uniref:hypothetical protein n=1 Tax=Nannocystis pusilla TaxID=889268 RepID=UPI003B823E6F
MLFALITGVEFPAPEIRAILEAGPGRSTASDSRRTSSIACPISNRPSCSTCCPLCSPRSPSAAV